MSHHDITMLFLALALMLGLALLLGELARRLRQPAVLGEILAGILLGPTVLGTLLPDVANAIFPREGPVFTALSAITAMCVVLFMMVAGLEVDLSTIFRLRKSAFLIGTAGILLPFAIGFSAGHFAPRMVGMEEGANHLAFALFLGVALSISALPVIAKTLMDLRLLKTDLGVVVMAVAIYHDLVGWIIFAFVLALMQDTGAASTGGAVTRTIVMTVAFAFLMLTLVRPAFDRILPWMQAHVRWPQGVLGLCVCLAFLAGSFTEYIGIHAIFGAFIVGLAIGDSRALTQRTRHTIESFIESAFAPLFFSSIGLKVNFIANFDLFLVLVVILISCLGMTIGSWIGARWAGFPSAQSWAIGFALNARGAMEIVLASLALKAGVIGEPLFVALVVMALFTSVIAGPMMQRCLNRPVPARFREFLRPQGFIPRMKSDTAQEALQELAQVAAPLVGRPAAQLAEAAWERHMTMSTGFPGGLAIPHARVPGLQRPVVVIGLSEEGIPWDSPDGRNARVVVCVFVSPEHSQQHLEILADVASTFQSGDTVRAAAATHDYTRFLAFLTIRGSDEPAHSPT